MSDSSNDTTINKTPGAGVSTGEDENVKRVFIGVPEQDMGADTARFHGIRYALDLKLGGSPASFKSEDRPTADEILTVADKFAEFLLNGLADKS